MILSPKQLFRLTTALTDLRITEDELKRITELAQLPQWRDIKFGYPNWKLWQEVLDKVADDLEAANKLIQKLIEEVPHAQHLKSYQDEINSSRAIRQKNIKKALAEGRCVVFLGPEALKVTDKRTSSFNEYLCMTLQKVMQVNYIYFSPRLKNNLSYLAQCYADDPQSAPGEIAAKAATVYKNLKTPNKFETGLFEELAKLPVKLVINANPDDLFLTELRKSGRTGAAMGFYDLSNDKQDSNLPGFSNENVEQKLTISPDKPFVYNIFGSFQSVDSVLYTESQFMAFINGIIQDDPPLNGDVIRELLENDTYLFLGFDFEQWYFKILFQFFKIKKEDYASVSCGFDNTAEIMHDMETHDGVNIYNREFFEQEFKIFFVNDDIKNFINEIVNLP